MNAGGEQIDSTINGDASGVQPNTFNMDAMHLLQLTPAAAPRSTGQTAGALNLDMLFTPMNMAMPAVNAATTATTSSNSDTCDGGM